MHSIRSVVDIRYSHITQVQSLRRQNLALKMNIEDQLNSAFIEDECDTTQEFDFSLSNQSILSEDMPRYPAYDFLIF